MKLSYFFSLSAILLSSLTVGCLEEEKETKIKNILDELDGQRFDIGRAKESIASQKVKLAKYQESAKALKEATELQALLEEVEEGITEGTLRNEELADSATLKQLEVDQLLKQHRGRIRRVAIGTDIDLSETMGDDFKAVRLMTVRPIGLKFYMPSGPQTVRLRDIPIKVQKNLLMSEKEAAEYLQRKGEGAAARANKLKKWREALSTQDSSEDEIESAFAQKIKEMQNAIYQREKAINLRVKEMQAMKSKASALELQVGIESNERKAARLDRYAELVRDKAQTLADTNSDAWGVIERLRVELESFKRTGKQ